MVKCKKLVTITAMAILFVAAGANAAVWEQLSDNTAGIRGGDLVSDGTNLYLVGGMSGDTSIFQYDAASNSWTTLTSDNPDAYWHYKDGAQWYSRTHYYYDSIEGVGKIITYATVGQSLNTYTLGGGWTADAFPLPGGESFAGGGGGQQNRVFNSTTGTFHAQLTAASGTSYSAPFDTVTGTFSAASTTLLPGIDGHWQLEDNGSKVFKLTSNYGSSIVQLQYYDTAVQPADFTGAWVATNTYDVGTAFISSAVWGGGLDMMAYDAATNKLYVIGAGTGVVVEYDIANNSWTRLPDIPGEGPQMTFNYMCVEVADGYLYLLEDNQGVGVGYGQFTRLQIIPEPATMALLGFGGLGLLIRRKK